MANKSEAQSSDVAISDRAASCAMKRLIIIGTSCSGKTTLARELARILEAPCIELDAIHWKPEWQRRPDNELRQMVEVAASGERWVIDGNYSSLRDIVWARGTAIIWLNYPLRVVLWRALYRTVRRAITGEELFSGNRESFRKSFFSKESILLWVIASYPRLRKTYRQVLDEGTYPHLRVVEFRNPAQAEAFIASVLSALAREAKVPSPLMGEGQSLP